MVEPDSKWYMAGTDGSGQYVVVAEGERGRVGYREIQPGIYRIRFEPRMDAESAELELIKATLSDWCPPQSGPSGDTFRFSILGKGKNALRYGISLGIQALGTIEAFNPAAPEYLTNLIDSPYDLEAEPVESPPQKSGYWIGKKACKTGETSWADQLKTKNTAFDADENEEDSGEEEEEEVEEEEEGEDEEGEESSTPTKSSTIDHKGEYSHATLMTWIKEEVPYLGTASQGKGLPLLSLTSAMYLIFRAEASKLGQSWNTSCSCTSCLRTTKVGLQIYEQAKLDYAKKVEEEKPLTESQIKEIAVSQAAELTKAAATLADTLKAFGF